MRLPSGCRMKNERWRWEGVGEAGTPRWWWSRLCRCEGTWTREKSGDGLEPPVDHGMDRAFPSACLAAQTKRWAQGIRVPAPLAGGGSTKAIALVVTAHFIKESLLLFIFHIQATF